MGKMLEEMHQNIMVILECLRGRIMGNSIFSCAFFWIFQVFYNQNVLFYNKEINFKKKKNPGFCLEGSTYPQNR